MEPFRRLETKLCPLPLANIDTDQLIPARFMSRPRSEGYGSALLHDVSRLPSGAPDPDFPLNRPAYAGAAAMVARRNFGCGSSREAAAYALLDAGFRCVIAPSFGDIFAANAVNNGLLPAVIAEADCEILLAAAAAGAPFAIDLETLTIAGHSLTLPFTLDPVWRTKLLNGWDDLDLTAQYAHRISAYFTARAAAEPWLSPRR